MKTETKKSATSKKPTATKTTHERKLGALKGKIALAADAFTPAEMRPYLRAKETAKKGKA